MRYVGERESIPHALDLEMAQKCESSWRTSLHEWNGLLANKVVVRAKGRKNLELTEILGKRESGASLGRRAKKRTNEEQRH